LISRGGSALIFSTGAAVLFMGYLSKSQEAADRQLFVSAYQVGAQQMAQQLSEKAEAAKSAQIQQAITDRSVQLAQLNAAQKAKEALQKAEDAKNKQAFEFTKNNLNAGFNELLNRRKSIENMQKEILRKPKEYNVEQAIQSTQKALDGLDNIIGEARVASSKVKPGETMDFSEYFAAASAIENPETPRSEEYLNYLRSQTERVDAVTGKVKQQTENLANPRQYQKDLFLGKAEGMYEFAKKTGIKLYPNQGKNGAGSGAKKGKQMSRTDVEAAVRDATNLGIYFSDDKKPQDPEVLAVINAAPSMVHSKLISGIYGNEMKQIYLLLKEEGVSPLDKTKRPDAKKFLTKLIENHSQESVRNAAMQLYEIMGFR
jgi:hypothetical protein